MALELIRPSLEWLHLEEDYGNFAEESNSREGLYARMAGDDFTGFILSLYKESMGIGLKVGRAPQTTLWLVQDGARILGASRVRNDLTPELEEWGGHIGYNVRPSEWGNGYGTELLRLTLPKAREAGLAQAVVMCEEANIGSRRVIEKNGGVLLNQGTRPGTDIPILRYVFHLG